MVGDLSQEDATERTLNDTIKHFNQLDILVSILYFLSTNNNAKNRG